MILCSSVRRKVYRPVASALTVMVQFWPSFDSPGRYEGMWVIFASADGSAFGCDSSGSGQSTSARAMGLLVRRVRVTVLPSQASTRAGSRGEVAGSLV